VAPNAHTIAEVMFARHGRSSQLMLAGSNVLGSIISLTSNLIAGGALISLLSPFTFTQGIITIGAGVLLYTLWSGFRASVLTDFAQVVAMLDRKSTRLNSSHVKISYAVFCLKKTK